MKITAEIVKEVRDQIAANTLIDSELPDWNDALYAVDDFLTDWIEELKVQESE